jgi:hypothetical protein
MDGQTSGSGRTTAHRIKLGKSSSAAVGRLTRGSADDHEPLPHAHLHVVDVVLGERAGVRERAPGAVHLLEGVLDPRLVAEEILDPRRTTSLDPGFPAAKSGSAPARSSPGSTEARRPVAQRPGRTGGTGAGASCSAGCCCSSAPRVAAAAAARSAPCAGIRADPGPSLCRHRLRHRRPCRTASSPGSSRAP